jgi:UDP-N-acetylglucosamine 2-epimerase
MQLLSKLIADEKLRRNLGSNAKNLVKAKFNCSNIRIIDPLGYIEMLKLLKHAKLVLTDSGGLQKEAFWSKTPCITLRDSTEWTETVEAGVNQIVGAGAEKIAQAIRTVDEKYDNIKERFKGKPFGDGNAAKKIVEILKKKDLSNRLDRDSVR